MTVPDPTIIEAVAGTKNKASTYNTNFANMVQYVKDCMTETATDVAQTLSLYQTVNTLSTQGTISLTTNTINTITPDGAVEFVLPTITGDDTGKFHQILVQVNLSTVYDIDFGTTYFFDLIEPSLSAGGLYDVIYEYDNASNNWVCGSVYKGALF